jgi:hypothetical protein
MIVLKAKLEKDKTQSNESTKANGTLTGCFSTRKFIALFEHRGSSPLELLLEVKGNVVDDLTLCQHHENPRRWVRCVKQAFFSGGLVGGWFTIRSATITVKKENVQLRLTQVDLRSQLESSRSF